MGIILIFILIIIVFGLVNLLNNPKNDIERIKNSDIYQDVIAQIDKANIDPIEMIANIRVEERYIVIHYFHPMPNKNSHTFKVELAKDKLDMYEQQMRALILAVAEYCISDMSMYNTYLKGTGRCGFSITIKEHIQEKYKRKYRTSVW